MPEHEQAVFDAESIEYLAETLERVAADLRNRAPVNMSWAIRRGVTYDAGREVRDVAEFKCELHWPEQADSP